MADDSPQGLSVATPEKFATFRKLALENDTFTLVSRDSAGTECWLRKEAGSNINIIKVCGIIKHSAECLYDVLHDPDYRGVWDQKMISGHDIARVGTNSDISYYAMKWPAPLKNRDFLTQRFWTVGEVDGKPEYLICNNSVALKEYPPTDKYVRAVSIRTGYYIHAIDDKSCRFIWISQTDPKGSLPKMVVNFFTKKVAPAGITVLSDACINYNDWKKKQAEPDYKPWLRPETNKLKEYLPADFAALQGDLAAAEAAIEANDAPLEQAEEAAIEDDIARGELEHDIEAMALAAGDGAAAGPSTTAVAAT